MGRLGAFSFYPTKNLGALGDGGALTTDHTPLAERVRRLREYGRTGPDEHIAVGVNSRLDELQAAVLRAKLPYVDAWNERRRSIAAVYDEAFGEGPVRPLRELPGRRHAYHLYVAAAPDREAFRQALAARGVGTLVHYSRPVHGHRPYARLGRHTSLEVSERLAAEVVSLPLYPELSDAEVEYVAATLRDVTAVAAR
jgi:dTDP-4-amino-4,6-dideoxygalactose transaminase